MDIRIIRDKADFIKENQIKRFLDPTVIDQILSLDQELKICIHKNDKLKTIKNTLSLSFKNAPEVETIIMTNEIEQYDFTLLTKSQLQILSKRLSEQIEILNKESKILLCNRDNLISTLGNFLYADVIISDNEDNNGLIYQTDIPEAKKYTHVELCEKLGFVDTINGSAVAGNRGYFLTGMGVKLNMALINYAMDFLNNRDYQLMSTPHMVSKEMMSKITQLSDYDETLYKLEGYDKYLIATSEQPLTAYFADKVLNKNTLPIKFAGLSSCYRKESGRHGAQTRGIYRVHQFEKVEQFCVTNPDDSWEMFEKMIKISQEFYDSLGIKYRVVSIVSGALNNAAAMKFDLEGYFCGLQDYGELVSCTNCLDYFSKKINTTLLQSKEHAHMLNCTLMANTRVICCLMEQYQTDDGMIIPEVLQKYIGCDFIPFPKI